ncbi:MAG: hypothetical protein QOG38_1871 [Hyphomicrobiales bacterium]|jgi:hypothetical protein|nr:hypothetical protein [Hyphomicrobiales bacterium]
MRRAGSAAHDHVADPRRKRVDRKGLDLISMPGTRNPLVMAAFSA